MRETRARHPLRRAVRSNRSSNEHVGEIKAHIFERDGKVVIEKTCPIHGTFTDTLAINPAFLRRLESLFPGRDFPAVTDTLHNHGTSSIQHGRGAVLTIDLTNRCNMMCDPCFMDANQVGYVHELTLAEVKQLLDDAVSIKPRRQMTVQFSGGEPTISPIFLDAVRYARAGRLLQRPGGDQRHPLRAGPGVRAPGARGGHAHRLPAVRRRHRGGQLAPQGRQPVRRQAARDREPARRRHRRLPGRHDRQHGQQRPGRARSSSSRLQNCDKISFVSFQPVSFTGRDEDITDEERHASATRCRTSPTTCKRQTGVTEPLRDWFPLSASSAMSERHRPDEGPRRRLGLAQLRVPSRLRRRHGLHGQQEDEGVGAAVGVHQRRAVARRTRGRSPMPRAAGR